MPIAVALRAVARDAQSAGNAQSIVTLQPIDDMPGGPVAIGLARVAGHSAQNSDEADAVSLMTGSRPGRVLAQAQPGALALQSDALWLVARAKQGETRSVALVPFNAQDGSVMALAGGDGASMQMQSPPANTTRLWRASAAQGRPGIAINGDADRSGRFMALGNTRALAIADSGALRVWNAESDAPMSVRLAAIDVANGAAIEPVAPGLYAASIAPGTMRTLALPAGDKIIAFDLAPGLALFAGKDEPQRLAIEAGTQAISRDAAGSWRMLRIVNLGMQPAAMRMSVGTSDVPALSPTQIFRRFSGASGSLSLPVASAAGDHLRSSGARATFVGADGRVLQGDDIAVNGPGELVLDHAQGPVAAWIERNGSNAWPQAAAKAVSLPTSVRLEGAAMAFALKLDKTGVLSLRTNAPVAIAIAQGARKSFDLYGAGAEVQRMMAAGEALVSLHPLYDGALSGALDMALRPVIDASEGVGDAVALAPGANALFAFKVVKAGEIGVGVRAEPDRVQARVLDQTGAIIGTGISQLVKLEPGSYLLDVIVPADGPSVLVRPALIGLALPPAGPPPEIAADFMEKAGLKPAGVK